MCLWQLTRLAGKYIVHSLILSRGNPRDSRDQYFYRGVAMQIKGRLSLTLPVFAGILLTAGAALAEPGNITGKVFDAKTKDALPFANVVVMGTGLGAMSMDDGSFFIQNVPEGTYAVKATYMGFDPDEVAEVVVQPYSTTEIEFRLYRTVLATADEVLVTAERPMVEVDVPTTVRSLSADDLKEMPVDDVAGALSLQAGVVLSDDEIHIRGGRTDETLYIIDGVQMKDLISGRSPSLNVSARSVAEMDVITGGYSAEFGQALSGVVNVKLKEGSTKQGGYFDYSADHLPWTSIGEKTFFHADRVEFGLDGPEPVTMNLLPRAGVRIPGQMTYSLGFSARVSDTHYPSINDVPGTDGLRSSYRDKFLWWDWGYDGWAPRGDNMWQVFGKLSWRYSSNNKFGLSWTKTLSIDQGYFRTDPYDVTRSLTGYQHEWSRRLDNYMVYTEDMNSLLLSWNHIVNQNSFWILKLSRFFNALQADVMGKHWHDYVEPDDFSELQEDDTPYYIETGTADLWHNRYLETWNLAWDMTKRVPAHHQIQGGINHSFEKAQYVFIRQPWVPDPDSLGLFHDIYTIHPMRGAMYVQDKMNYEGLIAEIGLRVDYWFPGEEVEEAVEDTTRSAITPTTRQNFYDDTYEVFGRRFKAHLSPRIAISHPITDRDNLFFNYGHFTQIPSYIWIYSKLASVSSELFPLIGNPNLNPEIAVQYEIGARHQFTESIAANITLFYKDIYDYPTSTSFEKPGVGTMYIYRNMDYARSQGIEIEVRKKQRGLVGGSASYTYSIATGKSSDPNTLKLVEEQGGDVGARESSLAEEYLWWNRPHKFNLMLNLQATDGQRYPLFFGWRLWDDWNLNIQWQLQNGRAYTPTVNGEEVAKRYSANGPWDNVWDVRYTQYFGSGRMRTKFYVDVRNLFNHTTVRRIDSETGEAPVPGRGEYATQGDSEYVQNQLSDPSIYGTPRQVRLGVAVEF
jgi:outer membrane receptor protein involved in Fe transport